MSEPQDPSVPATKAPEPTSSELVFYQGEDGRSRIQVRLDGGTVWLTQRLLADLFQKDVRTISEHLQNIFEEAELAPEATIRKFRIVQTEGNRKVAHKLAEGEYAKFEHKRIAAEAVADDAFDEAAKRLASPATASPATASTAPDRASTSNASKPKGKPE